MKNGLKSNVSRRDFVRAMGVGTALGAYLLSPFTRRLIAEAEGANMSGVRRFVLFRSAHGFDPYLWEPRSGPSDMLSADDFNPVMAPLKHYRQDMLFVGGTYNPCNPGLHNNGHATWRVVQTENRNSSPKGPNSSDIWTEIPQLNGENAPEFRSVVGSYLQNRDSTPYGRVEFTNAQSSKEQPRNPLTVFNRYFSDSGDANPTEAAKEAGRSRVLNAVRADAQALSARLAPAERAKLERYLSGLEQVERRLGAETVSCDIQSPEGFADDEFAGKRGSFRPDFANAYADMIPFVFECGLASFADYFLTAGRLNYDFLIEDGAFEHLATSAPDYHNVQHAAGNNDASVKAAGIDGVKAINTWQNQQMARVLDALDAVPEGDGTMLDRTLVLFHNDAGYRHHNGSDDVPCWMLCRDSAIRTNRYLRYPNKERCISDLFVSVMQTVGMPDEVFGDPSLCQGPLPEVFG